MKAVKNIIFLLGLILIFVLLSAVLCPEEIYRKSGIQDRNSSVAGIMAEKENTIDVLVLGDSESYTTVSPMKLWDEQGITSYVCGQAGQRMQESYHMLKTALKKQSPRLVLLETDGMFRWQGGVKEAEATLAEEINYYIPLVRYHNLWKAPFDKKKRDRSYKGFPIRMSVRPYRGGNYMSRTAEKAVVPQGVRNYLEKIQRLCEKEDIALLLYSAPSPKNYNYKKHNAVSEYAKEKGLAYIDFNLKQKELGIDWEKDSLDDGDHLNMSGAHKVTKYIGAYLKENYELTDHRGDETYRKWQKSAASYRRRAKRILERIESQ